MADREQRLAIVVTAKDLAAGKLKNVRGELNQLSTSGKLAAVGLGAPALAANRLGGALGNLKGRVMGLTGAIGPLLGVGGLLGLSSLLTSSITEAATFGANVQKVAAITNLATPVASAMVDTLDKWGVGADRLIPTLGKLMKNVGTIASTQAKANAFQKQYGVSLLDNNGRIADANTLLLRSADYFNSNAAATDKATFMSKLWGKAWQDMVPIMQKGSQFIRDAEADAIHLTDTQLKNIDRFRDAQRDFQDAFGDVQVKIGANLMPFFTSGLKTASAWFDANGDRVADFFRDAAEFGGKAAKAAGDIFNVLKTGWDSIPGPLRDLLVTGFVANKASKFLFNVGIGDIIGGFQSLRGSSPANPMYVADVTGGLAGAAGKGGLLGMLGGGGNVLSRLLRVGGGALLGFGGSQILSGGVQNNSPIQGGIGGIGMIAGGAMIAGPLGAIIGSVAGVVQTQQEISNRSTEQGRQLDATMKAWLAQSPSKEALKNGLAGVEQGIRDIESNPLNVLVQGDALNELKAMRDAINRELVKSRGVVGPEMFGPPAPGTTALTEIAGTMSVLREDFRDAVGALRAAVTPLEVIAAAQQVTASIRGGVGNAAQTEAAVADLRAKRDAAKAAGDTATVQALNAEIRKIVNLVPGREHQARVLAQGREIVESSKSQKQKVAELKTLQAEMISVQRTSAAAQLGELIKIVQGINNIKLPTTIQATVNALPGGAPRPPGSPPGPKPTSPAPRPAMNRSGSPDERGNAAGAFGLTRGWTPLGYAGEAGSEAVAIVRNPRPLASSPGSGLSRSDVAAIAAAVRVGMSSSRIEVTARSVTRAQAVDDAYSNRGAVTAD